MLFQLPTQDEILKIAPYLISKIVKMDEKYWYVKSKPESVNEEKREILGYVLGKNICNTAEVKLLSLEELGEVKSLLNLPGEATPQNTFLRRLASTYELEELPCQTIEKAVATELVYSIWIRRRDTHADNREYVKEGVPVFYDFHIAFLNEPLYAHSTAFFKFDPDYGHPAYWRVKEISGRMTTDQARSVTPPTNKAWHYVNNLELFKTELKNGEEAIKKITAPETNKAVAEAGFNEKASNTIQDFLAKNLITLSSDIEELNKIIFQS